MDIVLSPYNNCISSLEKKFFVRVRKRSYTVSRYSVSRLIEFMKNTTYASSEVVVTENGDLWFYWWGVE